ncbi:hypothetical protein LCGC14_0846690 [marine sediment metagenome]|uniref:Uncharacterized protein n=1 Tax=marine sediment metagenome TaxID=412755 RepID=A0A0F9RWD2_9ZZZZ
MDKNSAPLRGEDIDKYDDGIIEVMRDVLLIGTKGIDGKVLLNNEYNIKGMKGNLFMREYPLYTVSYLKRRSDGLCDLLAVAKREYT